jgi:hypothetical protein
VHALRLVGVVPLLACILADLRDLLDEARTMRARSGQVLRRQQRRTAADRN